MYTVIMQYLNKSFSKKDKPKLFTIHYSLFTIVTVLLLSSCGYKPVSHYTKNSIAEPLYLDIKLSSKEPDAGVFLKDELHKVIVRRLGVQTASASQFASKLTVRYDDISYVPLGYDSNGYVERYRVKTTTQFTLLSDGNKISRKIIATHEATVTLSVLESSRAKQKAIEECTKKAVDQFVAFMATRLFSSNMDSKSSLEL